MLELPVSIGAELLQRAAEEIESDLIHRQWCSLLPYMTQDNFISFSDYRDRVTGRNIDMRPTAQIVAELLALQADMEDTTNGNGDI